MLNEAVFLVSGGFYSGGNLGSVLSQWEAAGIFSYVLPFLLIFALVFVILSNIGIFKGNKGVNAVISLAVALMALQFDFVSLFFSEIFPRFGIALAIILVLVIIGGIFLDPETNAFKWLFAIIGIVIAGVVIIKSLLYFGWYTGGTTWFNVNWSSLLVIGIIIAAIIAVIASSSPTARMSIGMTPVFKGKDLTTP